jgi:stage V sporulation protein G
MKSEIQINAMNISKFDGKVKAFFDILVNGEIVIKGFKLVDGNNGRFVSMPREKSSKSEEWFDRVLLLNNDLKLDLEMLANTHYLKMIKIQENQNENNS